MGALKTEGIILRKYLLRETSYILVAYTKDYGKIKGVVKGARNPAPQFGGNFEIFTHSEFLFYRKKKRPLDLITGCETLDFFLPVRKEIERLTYANYYIELIDIVCNENDPNKHIFEVLRESLRFLSTGASARRVTRIFELKLLEALGLSPNLNSCIECSAREEKKYYFSVKSGGILCSKCRTSDRGAFPVSNGTVNFIRRIQKTPLEKTAHIKVSKDVGVEIEKLLKNFLDFYLHRQAKSLLFLKELEKVGAVKV